jgi:hypothetical protein
LGLCKADSVGRSATVALRVVAMAAVVVAVDVLFLRGHFLARLAANVGIVLVFGAFYVRFLHHAYATLAQTNVASPDGGG